MRFDDTLETVLAADLTTPLGKQSAWRQLVDLIGRRRAPPDSRALAALHAIRDEVPETVRAASARGLEFADPPVALVRLLAVDSVAIAAPVLRSARLSSADWIAMLADLSPAARAVLRGRRDLGPAVKRALAGFEAADFILGDAAAAPAETLVEWTDIVAAEARFELPEENDPAEAMPVAAPRIESAPEPVDWTEVIAADTAPEPQPEAPSPTRAEPRDDAQPVIYWSGVFASGSASEGPPAAGPVADPQPAPRPEAPVPIADVELAPAGVQAPLAEQSTPAPASSSAEDAEDLSFVALAGFAATLSGAAPAASSTPTAQVMHSETPVPVADREPEAQDSPVMVDPLRVEPGLRARDAVEASPPAAISAATPTAESAHEDAGEAEGPFQIAEVVARIDAFWRRQQEAPSRTVPIPAEPQPEGFRFETDSKGVIRWVDGVSRAPIVGLSLDLPGVPGTARVDGVASGAFRRRAGFSNARLAIEGDSDAAGDWLISGIPVFDPSNGRFTGYRGTARRPRADERAEPSRSPPANPADSLRQLVHELRTPTNAIAGFAEMIETQILGPVAEPYRNHASVIRTQAKELLGAIDDLDLAARIESHALSLVPAQVQLRPVLAGIADDLAQLAELRGAWIALPVDDLAVLGDRRAVERLLARLMATLVSASGAGERIGVRTAVEGDDVIAITLERPAALADFPGDAMLGIDDEGSDATLLGTGFALRLARNLAKELGGSLVIEPDSLTLRLPAAVTAPVEQAHLN